MGLGEDELPNRKIKKKQKQNISSSENLIEALFDWEKVKTKGVFESEKLNTTLEDGDVHLPLVGTQILEQSSILIEEMQEVNLGTK